MNFSVKNLLCLTFLAALTVNGCNRYYQLKELRSETPQLNFRLNAYRDQTAFYEQKTLMYERALEATERRVLEFEKCELAFEMLAQKKSQLEIVDREKVHLIEIPTLKEKDKRIYQSRIWLPKSHAFLLQATAQKLGSSMPKLEPELVKRLGESKFFDPPMSNRISLDHGESIVKLEWYHGPEFAQVKLFVNEKLVHQAKTSQPLVNKSWFRTATETQASNEIESAVLFGNSFHPESDDDDDEVFLLRLIAGPLETGQGND